MLGCSSVSHTWDAFQLAHASFRLHCVRNNHVQSVKLGPRLLGDAPKINISPPETEMVDEEGSSEVTPAIKIYDEEINIKLLLCGVPCSLVSFYIYVQTLFLILFECKLMILFFTLPQDPCLLGSLEDGLNALLNIEVWTIILAYNPYCVETSYCFFLEVTDDSSVLMLC